MKVDASAARPWLSVVMPSHRGERWIDTALLSLAEEWARGIEVLLVDSGDTAAARDIAQTFSNRVRIRIFERRDLRSWHAKTNFGIEMAESEHVCWLGVDDVWLPGRAVAARAWIAAAPEAPLHFAPCEIIGNDGRKLGVWRCPLPEEYPLESTFVSERLLVQNFVAAPAPIFRKDAWLNCGGLDETLWYTADWDMWLKLAARAPTYYHDEVTVGFRIHAASLTVTGSRDNIDFRRQMQTVLERHLHKLKTRSKATERAGRASIAINMALASAAAGNFSALPRAVSQVALLGPVGIRRYFRDSRIIERLMPRLRAKFTGSF
jgi:glycosyltransferase involved in cell wall biosynthesis